MTVLTSQHENQPIRPCRRSRRYQHQCILGLRNKLLISEGLLKYTSTLIQSSQPQAGSQRIQAELYCSEHLMFQGWPSRHLYTKKTGYPQWKTFETNKKFKRQCINFWSTHKRLENNGACSMECCSVWSSPRVAFYWSVMRRNQEKTFRNFYSKLTLPCHPSMWSVIYFYCSFIKVSVHDRLQKFKGLILCHTYRLEHTDLQSSSKGLDRGFNHDLKFL